jgi:zinc protease
MLAFAAACAGTAASAQGPQVADFTLANGLQVVVIPDHRTPVITHMIWYKVGSADEPAGRSGIAHFLEHLMFKGTEKNPAGRFSQTLATIGGQENAFTTTDYTGYFQRVAREHLATVMEFEADRMTGLVLTDANVLPERDVVLEEQNMRVANSPEARLGEQMSAALYLNHPYGKPVIGWMSEIEALTTEKALAFYKRYYMPNNAVLVVAGDITPDEVRAIATRTYGAVPRGTVPARLRPKEPPHTAAMRISMTSARVREPEWSRRYIAPSYRLDPGKQAYALEVLAEALGGGATSRLYRGLVVDKGIANSAGAGYDPSEYDAAEFVFYGSPREGSSPAALEAAVDAEIKRLLEAGVTAEEVARAKARLQSSAIYARDSLRTAPNVIGRTLMTGGTIEDVESWPERIEAVTVAEVNAAAKAVLDIGKSMTTTLLPEQRAE